MLSIWCVGRELIDAMDSTCHLSLSFQLWFLGLLRLSFHWRFMDEERHSVFEYSMHHHDSIFAIDLICPSWIHWHYRFYTSSVTQYSWTISMAAVTLFSLKIYGSAMTYRFWQFHVSSMILFMLSISCVFREFIDVVDSIRQLSLSIHWRFQRLKRLSFHWRFLDQKWRRVFDNSMRQPWLYFCYWFKASNVNSLPLSIPYVSCHSVSMMISWSTATQFSLTIYGSAVT